MLALAASFSVPSSAVAAPKIIAYIGYSSTNNFWLTVKKGVAEAAASHKIGIIDLTAKDPDSAKQNEAIQNAVNKKVSGIIIGPVHDKELTKSLDMAAAAKIPVVVVDTPVDHHWVSSTVATNNLSAAKLAGAFLVKKLAKGDKVLIIGGADGHVTGEARKDGVQSELQAAGFETVYHSANWKEDQAFMIADRELKKDPAIKAIFAAWDPGIMTARKAVPANRVKQTLLVGFDALPEALLAIKKGELHATVRQDPHQMGRVSVENVLKVLSGETVAKASHIDGMLIDKSNVDKFLNLSH
jgi:ribose transport system substrate-binding protein